MYQPPKWGWLAFDRALNPVRLCIIVPSIFITCSCLLMIVVVPEHFKLAIYIDLIVTRMWVFIIIFDSLGCFKFLRNLIVQVKGAVVFLYWMGAFRCDADLSI